MKKYTLLLAALALVLFGCEGDDPAGPDGTLDVVTGLTIDETASTGRDIVLNWNTVDGAEEYEIYFSTTDGSWGSPATTVTGTTYTHTASSAGYYTVLAVAGDDESSGYATSVNTMPMDVSDTFTIVDQYATASMPSGFFFGDENGTGYGTVMVSQSNEYDIYAYDDTGRGDEDVKFRSGDYGDSPYGMGYDCDFNESGSGYPSGTWSSDYTSSLSDGDVIFVRLNSFPNDVVYYVKITVSDVYPDDATNNGTWVDFSYEFQTLPNVYVFTE